MRIVVLIMLSFVCTSCSNQKNTDIFTLKNDGITSIGLISYKEKHKDTIVIGHRDTVVVEHRDTIFIKDKNEINKFAADLTKGIKTQDILVFVPNYRAIFIYENSRDVYLLSNKYFKCNEGIFKTPENFDNLCNEIIQKYKK